MSHRCAHVMEQVYFYLDDEMSWFRRVRVRRHLKRCSGCFDTFEFETQFKQFIRDNGHDEPAPELIDRLRAFIREHGSDESVA